jgi:transcriptional regulator with XRE-family HTH domain
MFIGKKIKELRKIQGLTLLQLAEKSGVQIATLSRIENLKMTGTLESHMSIAKALGIDATALYTDIIREGEKKTKESPKTSDVFIHSDKSSYEILTNNVLSKRMMPMLFKIDSGGRTKKDQNKTGSEKFIFILEGKIEVRIGEETFALGKNNSLYFNSSVEHYLTNTGNTPAKILCIATPVVL